LYAANSVLGVVVEISLEERRITRQAHFPASDQPEGKQAGAALISVFSPDGGMLYLSGGDAVWPYATKTGAVLSPYPVDGEIVGLGITADGQNLFVARAELPVLILDTNSGRPASTAGD
jgi:hypothetical protein